MAERYEEHRDFVFLNQFFNGGMVNTDGTAIDVATAILRGHFGDDEVLRQQPLTAADAGDSWIVEGAYKDPNLGGAGAWFIRIMKDDGRVTDIGHRGPPFEVPDVVRRLKKPRSESP